MHDSLHLCLVLFTLAYLRMLSFVFRHVGVFLRSYVMEERIQWMFE